MRRLIREELKAYSFLNLMAEKLRSLLQQPTRHRNRRQDVYDLNLLISDCHGLEDTELQRLMELIVASCESRGIVATRASISNPEVKSMAQEGYADLGAEVEGDLPEFEASYAVVSTFYESLPWPVVEPSAD